MQDVWLLTWLKGRRRSVAVALGAVALAGTFAVVVIAHSLDHFPAEAGWTGIEVTADIHMAESAPCIPYAVDDHGKRIVGTSQHGYVRIDVPPGTYRVSDINWPPTEDLMHVTVEEGKHTLVRPPEAQFLVACLSGS